MRRLIWVQAGEAARVRDTFLLQSFFFWGPIPQKGMSQYGARGRAQNGQELQRNFEGYTGVIRKEPINKDTGGTISVAGAVTLILKNYYLMGIAEVPSTWHPDVLKAQAVAA